jgi:hypothetical protein
VARIQSIVSNAGEVDGVRLLSPRTIELIFDQQSDGVDLAVGLPARFGIGYGLAHPELVPYIPDVAAVSGSDGEGPSSSMTSTGR